MARNTEQFWEMVQEYFFDGPASGLAYEDFINMGVDCGLLAVEEFDPENEAHQVEGAGDYMEPGDPVYLVIPKKRRK